MAVSGSRHPGEAMASEDLSNVELQNFFSSKRSPVHHVRGKFLSIAEVDRILMKEKQNLNGSGKKMLDTLQNLKPHDFQLIRQEFQVLHLQHVTDESSMEGILNQEHFLTNTMVSRPQFSDFSFWSASIGSKDITNARKESYKKAKSVQMEKQRESAKVVLPSEERKIKAQFANSPAFKPSSRYGNFKFSFKLSELLALYQAQHCGGEEPHLRVLGTDLYKQEITHFVLVHSPGEMEEFQNLPMIPTAEGGTQHVYLRNKEIFWRPESTSFKLKIKICRGDPGVRTCHPPCKFYRETSSCAHLTEKLYKVLSVWNHLVFAFHLPNQRSLTIEKKQLLRSLKACEVGDSPVIDKNKQLEKEQAEQIVKMKKAEGLKRKTCSEDLNGASKSSKPGKRSRKSGEGLEVD